MCHRATKKKEPLMQQLQQTFTTVCRIMIWHSWELAFAIHLYVFKELVRLGSTMYVWIGSAGGEYKFPAS